MLSQVNAERLTIDLHHAPCGAFPAKISFHGPAPKPREFRLPIGRKGASYGAENLVSRGLLENKGMPSFHLGIAIYQAVREDPARDRDRQRAVALREEVYRFERRLL